MNSEPGTRNSELPFVLVNMAMTADGKIATANRTVSSFGSARDHRHLLELRATADAVMAGARTVDLNLINLGPGPAKFRRARLRRGLAEYNLRVIVSGSGSINPRAEVFKHRFTTLDNPLPMNQPTPRPSQEGSKATGARLQFPSWNGFGVGSGEQFVSMRDSWSLSPSDGERDGVRGRAVARSPIIVLTTQRASKSKLKKLRALADEVKICGKMGINFRHALRWLSKKWGVKRLVCEGGGELNDALFRAGLVNELHLTVCPKIFGGRDAPTIADGFGAAGLSAASQFSLKSARCLGDEMFLVFQRG